MFPDHPVVEKFQLAQTKLMYITNFWLAPHFQDILKQKINNSDFFIVSFDESLNKSTQTCQMDLGIRFWNKEMMQVEVRYWNSKFLGHAKHMDLVEHFNKALEGLDLSKIIQISMDGPNVNWCFFDEIVKWRNEMEMNPLINLGSCGLHILHGAFKSGIEATDWGIKATMKGCFQLLHDSPARRADFVSVTGSELFAVFFCATRWVEDRDVADRLLKIWVHIKSINNQNQNNQNAKASPMLTRQLMMNCILSNCHSSVTLLQFLNSSYVSIRLRIL